MEFFGHVDILARIADAVERAGPGLVARPSEEAGEVQLAVALAELGACYARVEFQGEFHDSALTDAVDFLVKHVEDLAHAVGGGNDVAPERPPAVIGHPDHGARRAVDFVVEPAKGLVVSVDGLAFVIAPHVAVEPAGLDPVDPVRGRPMALVVGDEDFARRAQAQAVRCAEPVGDELALRSVA